MTAPMPLARVATSGRFDYQAIGDRPDYCWPQGARLAVYLGFNVEHFAFGSGLGANLGPASPQPDVLNYAWREYGNRVGAWRCLDLFDELVLPTGALINTALYDHCPELVQALVARGDELIGHGHSNAMRQSDLSEADESALLAGCRQRIMERSGAAPDGWLSPWISETLVTPDLLAETGYGYTLNWCHDDQPTRMRTRSGQTLWSIPYPQEVNDIPMVMGRLMDGRAFGELITDHFDEMRRQAARQPLVMGIALHPYIVGQPHRLLHLRKALEHLMRARDAGDVWFTTPGQIYQHMLSIHP
jgi:allantoinase